MPSARSARMTLSLVRWPEISTSVRRRPMPWIWRLHLTSQTRSSSGPSPMIAIRFCAFGHLRWYSKLATLAPPPCRRRPTRATSCRSRRSRSRSVGSGSGACGGTAARDRRPGKMRMIAPLRAWFTAAWMLRVWQRLSCRRPLALQLRLVAEGAPHPLRRVLLADVDDLVGRLAVLRYGADAAVREEGVTLRVRERRRSGDREHGERDQDASHDICNEAPCKNLRYELGMG